jgi:hypothetical protein
MRHGKDSGVTGRNGFGLHYLPRVVREQSHMLMQVWVLSACGGPRPSPGLATVR